MICHNRRAGTDDAGSPRCRALAVITLALAGLAGAGCAATDPTTAAVPAWELAAAEPFTPVPVGRARLSFDRRLPAHVVQTLSPEFSLITIRSARDWADVRRALHLPPAPPEVDLSNGAIVGLLASVGESVEDQWPLQLRSLRRRGTEGFLDAAFTPGLYYPLLTAGYIDLVYAPGIRRIGLVAIDKRRFVIPSPGRSN